MNYTIHLTEKCNLNCKYCYEKNKGNKDISFEYIKNIIDFEAESEGKYCVITFYGGEPLLKKDLIKDTVEYAKSKKTKKIFLYGITTNGILLDEELLKYMKKNNFRNIAYSLDGIKESHDLNRVMINGEATYDIVSENAKKLLSYFKDSVAMCVVTKNNLKYLEQNVKYLVDNGFYYINTLIDYTDDWQDEDLEEMKRQYLGVAKIYANKMLKEEEIYLPIFDEKIKTYIKSGFNCNDNCNLGMKSVNVGTDGNYYPCMQFVKNQKFIIGNTKDGIDIKAREELVKSSRKEMNLCKSCSINKRCKHTCACKNYLINEDINKLSPLVCEIERMMIEISDKVAEELYEKKSKIFMKKFYNN